MNIKFKATLIILALMLLTSLILAKREESIKKIETPVTDSVSQQVVFNEAPTVSNRTMCVRYIQRPKLNAQTIELSSTGLNAELPLPELMQHSGFKVEFESEIDYNNIEPNIVN